MVVLVRGRPAERRRTRPVLSRGAAFWLTGLVALAMPTASTIPSPMYVLYQQRWHFSDAMITVIFSVYCFVTLASMLLFGGLSDTIGRRRVLLISLGSVALSLVLFSVSTGIGWLILARAVQGFGCGTGGCAVSAALIELAPARAPGRGALFGSITPIMGVGVGAAGAGLLLDHAPAPTVLPYLVMLAVVVSAAAGVAFLPETAPRSRRAGAFAPRRISVPEPVRSRFAALATSVVAVWAVGGLYLSLGPSIAAELLHRNGATLAGMVVAILAGCGAVATLACQPLRPRRAVGAGSALLLAGLALVLCALAAGSNALFVTGTAGIGFGWGATYLGAFRMMSGLAEPGRRGELMATVNLVANLGTAVPSIGAGLAVSEVGLRAGTDLFVVVVAVLVVLGMITLPLVPDFREPRIP